MGLEFFLEKESIRMGKAIGVSNFPSNPRVEFGLG